MKSITLGNDKFINNSDVNVVYTHITDMEPLKSQV